jgi:hypothetical protein
MNAVAQPIVPERNIAAQIVQSLKGSLRELAHFVIAGGKASDRDVEHRMYALASEESARYALEHMSAALPVHGRKHGGGGRLDLLEHALTLVTIDGFHAEFGVYKGETLTFISQRIGAVAYGFDSFEGLPGDWFLGVRKGHFSLNGEPPALNIMQNNYRLVKGMFADSVPLFTSQIEDKCAFLHIDCALYESAKTVLDGLADRFVPGTVIVFDRFFNYPGWQKHGFRAFQEFASARGLKYRYDAFAPGQFSVAIVVE